jgi:hypothetical protein
MKEEERREKRLERLEMMKAVQIAFQFLVNQRATPFTITYRETRGVGEITETMECSLSSWEEGNDQAKS